MATDDDDDRLVIDMDPEPVLVSVESCDESDLIAFPSVTPIIDISSKDEDDADDDKPISVIVGQNQRVNGTHIVPRSGPPIPLGGFPSNTGDASSSPTTITANRTYRPPTNWRRGISHSVSESARGPVVSYPEHSRINFSNFPPGVDHNGASRKGDTRMRQGGSEKPIDLVNTAIGKTSRTPGINRSASQPNRTASQPNRTASQPNFQNQQRSVSNNEKFSKSNQNRSV